MKSQSSIENSTAQIHHPSLHSRGNIAILNVCDTEKAEKQRFISQLKTALLAKEWSVGIVNHINEKQPHLTTKLFQDTEKPWYFISHGCDTSQALNIQANPSAHILLTSQASLLHQLSNIARPVLIINTDTINAENNSLQKSPSPNIEIVTLPQSDYYFNYQMDNLSSFITNWISEPPSH